MRIIKLLNSFKTYGYTVTVMNIFYLSIGKEIPHFCIIFAKDYALRQYRRSARHDVTITEEWESRKEHC